jgi:hypothetical protein
MTQVIFVGRRPRNELGNGSGGGIIDFVLPKERILIILTSKVGEILRLTSGKNFLFAGYIAHTHRATEVSRK